MEYLKEIQEMRSRKIDLMKKEHLMPLEDYELRMLNMLSDRFDDSADVSQIIQAMNRVQLRFSNILASMIENEQAIRRVD